MSKEDRYSHLGTDDNSSESDGMEETDTTADDSDASSSSASEKRLECDGLSISVPSEAPDEPIRIHIEDADITPDDIITALEQRDADPDDAQSDPLLESVRMSSRIQRVALTAAAAGTTLGAVGAAAVLRRLRQ